MIRYLEEHLCLRLSSRASLSSCSVLLAASSSGIDDGVNVIVVGGDVEFSWGKKNNRILGVSNFPLLIHKNF